jgi:hypothetical protein
MHSQSINNVPGGSNEDYGYGGRNEMQYQDNDGVRAPDRQRVEKLIPSEHEMYNE